MILTCIYCQENMDMDRPIQQAVELFACSSCMNPLLLRSGTGTFDVEAIPEYGDTRMITQEGSIGGRLMLRVRESFENLPILPEISSRVTAMVDDDDASIQDLSELVSEDTVIAAKIIQVANSAYYRGLNEIVDINSACARLGMRSVANTVQSVALDHVFHAEGESFNELMRRLWRHSVAVAHLSSEIAVLQSMTGSETVYLAGLLHDIGKIAITATVANEANEDIQELRERPELLNELTMRFHTLVGLHIALRWGIPSDLCAAIFYHHTPDESISAETKKVAHIVALADAVAHVTGFPSEHTLDVSLITFASATFFSMSDVKLASLRVDLEDRMDKFMGAIAS